MARMIGAGRPLAAVVAALALLFAGGRSLGYFRGTGYTVDIAFPEATNVVNGNRVLVDGLQVGWVRGVHARDGRAIVRVSVDERHAPLREGTKASIQWRALLGERVVELEPGPASNRPIRSGGLLSGGGARPELDQVLATLDAPARDQVVSLVSQLDEVTNSSADDLTATLRTAGPAVQALGEVISGVGRDGEALRDLVSKLGELSDRLVAKRGEVAATIDGLETGLRALADRNDAMRAALRELPATVAQANETLDAVPAAVDALVPLVDDLAPAAERLPGLAADLRPLVGDARALLADLRPAVGSLRQVLAAAPRVLDDTRDILPPLTKASRDLLPAVDYLRPYTPELAGWLTGFGSAAAGYDASGHWARIFVREGSFAVDRLPTTSAPGTRHTTERKPGHNVNQPWTDARGEGMR